MICLCRPDYWLRAWRRGPARAELPVALVGSTVSAAIGNAASGAVSLAAAKITRDVSRSMFMVSAAKISTVLVVALAGAGAFAPILVHSAKLLAHEPSDDKASHALASWIGKKVVTKYGAPVRVENPAAAPDKSFRIYTVQELRGEEVKLVAEGAAGWIGSTEVVLLDQAIDFYTRELRNKPENAAAFRQRGLIWNFKEERDKAIADFTAAIRLDPKDAWTYADRGDVFLAMNQFDKAIADFTDAVRIDPKYVWAFASRGAAWSSKQDFDQAIADYTEAIRLDPKYAWAYRGRGVAWDNKIAHDKALADFDQAIRLDPKDA